MIYCGSYLRILTYSHFSKRGKVGVLLRHAVYLQSCNINLRFFAKISKWQIGVWNTVLVLKWTVANGKLERNAISRCDVCRLGNVQSSEVRASFITVSDDWHIGASSTRQHYWFCQLSWSPSVISFNIVTFSSRLMFLNFRELTTCHTYRCSK